MQDPSVIVYSSPDCPYCRLAKEFLIARNISFQEHDISKDRNRAQEMMRISQQGGVPVLQINGRIVVGFRKELIEDALSKKTPPKREELMKNVFFDPFDV